MRNILFTLGVGIVAFIIFYIIITVSYDPFKGKEQYAELIDLALKKAGIVERTWQTAVVIASRETDIPPALLWDEWIKLENWPEWSDHLHKSTNWVSNDKWQPGNQFKQVLDLGFPIGTITSLEVIGDVEPGRKVMWWKDKDGMKACHIWKFEVAPNGKSRITNVEVFHGMAIGILKPIVIRNWQKKFDGGLDAFLRRF